MHAAETLALPTGKPIEIGVVRAGCCGSGVAPENPIANLKTLYGTGFVKLNDKTGKVERLWDQVHDQGRIITTRENFSPHVAAMCGRRKRENAEWAQ